MEVTMQWWDTADDLWFAVRHRLTGLAPSAALAWRWLLAVAAACLLL